MSYLVLARKWRPQRFEDIVGQEFVAKTLQNAISTNRVAHALLFTGARGVGKTSAARILAKSLNCKEGPTTTPCNVCENCKEIAEGSNIDVFEIDGASNRGIDEVRELRENIKYFPSKSKYKIYIIDEVHMLTKEAFNALLKTLEEPPPHVVFIFATTEPHKIPITILSRCQRYDFKKISLKDIFEHLKLILKEEGIKISDVSVMQIAKAANGSMRDGQSILDQIISYGGNEISDDDVNSILGVIDRKLIFSLAEAVIKKDANTALKVINKVYNYGYDINQFCFNILETFRDIVAFKVVDDPKEITELSDGELKEISSFADEIDVKELLLIFNILYKAEEDITKSLTPKILLEMSVLKTINRFPILPIAALMKKIEALEKKILRRGDKVIAIEEYSAKAPAEIKETDKIPLKSDVSEERADKEGAHVKKSSTKDFIDFIKAKSILLYSHIESLKDFKVNENKITICAANSFSFEYFESAEIQKELKELANQFFNKNFNIKIKTVEKAGKNSLYNNKEAKSKREMISEGENSDPIFTRVKELFEGKIVDFRFKYQ